MRSTPRCAFPVLSGRVDDLEPENMVEALVAGGERKAVLLAEGGYPDVVLLNRDAGFSQQRGGLSEDACGLLAELEYLHSWCGEEAFKALGVLV